MTIEVDEQQRQIILLALAHLSVERPGWDFTIRDIAKLMDDDRVSMFLEFKLLRSQASKSRLVIT